MTECFLIGLLLFPAHLYFNGVSKLPSHFTPVQPLAGAGLLSPFPCRQRWHRLPATGEGQQVRDSRWEKQSAPCGQGKENRHFGTRDIPLQGEGPLCCKAKPSHALGRGKRLPEQSLCSSVPCET